MLCRASFSVSVPYFSVNQEFVTQKDILILLIVKVQDQPGRDYFIIVAFTLARHATLRRHVAQGSVLLLRHDAIARILANRSAAFFKATLPLAEMLVTA